MPDNHRGNYRQHAKSAGVAAGSPVARSPEYRIGDGMIVISAFDSSPTYQCCPDTRESRGRVGDLSVREMTANGPCDKGARYRLFQRRGCCSVLAYHAAAICLLLIVGMRKPLFSSSLVMGHLRLHFDQSKDRAQEFSGRQRHCYFPRLSNRYTLLTEIPTVDDCDRRYAQARMPSPFNLHVCYPAQVPIVGKPWHPW